MTTTREAMTLAHALMGDHGLTGWEFGLMNGRARAGQCKYPSVFRGTPGRIELSRHFVRLNPPERIRLTLLHEIAHALTPGHNHDAVWRAKCLEIGGDGQREYDLESTEMPTSRYLGVCQTNSLHTFARHKRSPAMAPGASVCPKCYIKGTNRGAISWSMRALSRA